MSESRQERAARNVDAILDAAEDALVGGKAINFSTLAADAGVSRPTVYSHFPDRAQLLEAVVRRNAAQVVAAVESAEPGDDDPVAALRRVICAGWEPLARHHALAGAIRGEIAPESVHAAHHQAVAVFGRLISRGRSQGAFRTDVPVGWLVTASLALVHASAAATRSGQMSSRAALNALNATVVDLCCGCGAGPG